MKQYQCRICGLPKKGHTCLGAPSAPQPKRPKTSDGYTLDQHTAQPAPNIGSSTNGVDVQALLDKHMENVKSVLQQVLPGTVSSKPAAVPHAYDMLVEEVTNQYNAAITNAQKQYDIDMAAASVAHAKSLAEYNAQISTSGSMTRIVEFLVSPPDTWQAVDSSIQPLLLSLFDETDNSKWTIQYNSHGHSYRAIKLGAQGPVLQENTKYNTKRELRVKDVPAASSHSSPPQLQSVEPWQNKIYFDIWPITLSNDFYTELLTRFSYDLTTEMINGQNTSCQSAAIAHLATVFDSFGCGQTYSPSKTELWANPPLMATFLRMARNRNYNELRVVMHGSGSYTAMRADPYLFDTTVLTAARKGHGIYVSCSPHIANEYFQTKKDSSRGEQSIDAKAGVQYPNGTVLIGLLLRQKDSTCKNTKCDSLHTYEQYHLGSSTQTEVPGKDAFVVRDAGHLLWLGLCVP